MLHWLSKLYSRRMQTSGCWQSMSQMANALASFFFKMKGSILKPVKRILENRSEHNKVNRPGVTFSSSTALYWEWIHLQKKSKLQLLTTKFSIEFYPHKKKKKSHFLKACIFSSKKKLIFCFWHIFNALFASSIHEGKIVMN